MLNRRKSPDQTIPLSRLVLICLTLCSINLRAADGESAFPGLVGPSQATVLPAEKTDPTGYSRYHGNGRNGLAIYLRDEQSSWLGLAHGLKAHGVPFLITMDLDEALSHDVVLVYPDLTGANATPDLLQRLRDFLGSGRSLIAFSVIGRGMSDIFGYGSFAERNDLASLSFSESELMTQALLEPTESAIRLAGPNQQAGGVSYGELAYTPIATFDDGSGAIVYNRTSNGSETGFAYAVGFDISHFALRAWNGRLAGAAKNYVNTYHPKIDSLFRFIAAVYWQGESNPIQILSTPFNHEFTALITHDVDYTKSLANVGEYVALEESLGIPATYFIQTKYVTDYNDHAFFSLDSQSIIERLLDAGMAVESHSVAHSNEFRNMPIGSGAEYYPQYQPFVENFAAVRGASIAGELRVSKFLLEQLGAPAVTAFRPGHLSLPRRLPQMLEATGYRYSSSITANEALTHLPYQTMFSAEYHSETPVYEFPVTIEDEQGDLLERLESSIQLADRIGRYGGLVNLLIHTDETHRKLEFERRFVEEFRNRAWFTTVPELGDWWRARDSVLVEVKEAGEAARKLTVEAPVTLSGLALRVPDSWQAVELPGNVRMAGDVLIFDTLSGRQELTLQVKPHKVEQGSD